VIRLYHGHVAKGVRGASCFVLILNANAAQAHQLKIRKHLQVAEQVGIVDKPRWDCEPGPPSGERVRTKLAWHTAPTQMPSRSWNSDIFGAE
jgi:hypothetical protein